LATRKIKPNRISFKFGWVENQQTLNNTNAQNYQFQGSIHNDTTWSSDTVKIYNDIVIDNLATLYINPGVYVEFQGNFSLTVYGRIRAIGTQYDTINFTIYDTTSFGDTATLKGGWGSIKLRDNTTDTSVFSYCKFSYGKAVEPGITIWDHLNEENMGGLCLLKIMQT